MATRKYKQGKKITSLQAFEKSNCIWFEVHFNGKSKMWHRSALESLQVHTLKNWLYTGRVFETIKINGTIVIDEFTGE